MYWDRNSGFNNREGWKYSVPGKELEHYTRIKLESVRIQERESRNKMAELLASEQKISMQSSEVQTLQNQIAELARQVELLEVIVVGCQRGPERDFTLASGDMVYFGFTDTALRKAVQAALEAA